MFANYALEMGTLTRSNPVFYPTADVNRLVPNICAKFQSIWACTEQTKSQNVRLMLSQPYANFNTTITFEKSKI